MCVCVCKYSIFIAFWRVFVRLWMKSKLIKSLLMKQHAEWNPEQQLLLWNALMYMNLFCGIKSSISTITSCFHIFLFFSHKLLSLTVAVDLWSGHDSCRHVCGEGWLSDSTHVAVHHLLTSAETASGPRLAGANHTLPCWPCQWSVRKNNRREAYAHDGRDGRVESVKGIYFNSVLMQAVALFTFSCIGGCMLLTWRESSQKTGSLG